MFRTTKTALINFNTHFSNCMGDNIHAQVQDSNTREKTATTKTASASILQKLKVPHEDFAGFPKIHSAHAITLTLPKPQPTVDDNVSSSQALARTITASSIGQSLLPFEKMFVQVFVKNNKKPLIDVFQQCTYSGGLGLLGMDLVKNGTVFFLQSAIGGHLGYFAGGTAEGTIAAAQRVIKFKMQTTNALDSLEVFKKVPAQELYSAARWNLITGPIQSGLFWLLFPAIASKTENQAAEFIKTHAQADNTLLVSGARFSARFASAFTVGTLTYPLYHYNLHKMNKPEITFAEDLQALKQVYQSGGIKAVTKLSYRGVFPGVCLFSLNKALVWTGIGIVDSVYATKRAAKSATA